jgi:hypothetical protein
MTYMEEWRRQGHEQASMCSCCGRMEGNVVEVWRTPGVFVFPFTFLIGPDWGCNLITYALTVVPSISFLVFACVGRGGGGGAGRAAVLSAVQRRQGVLAVWEGGEG